MVEVIVSDLLVCREDAGVVLPQEDEPCSDDLPAHNKLTAELSLEMLVVCRVAGEEYDDLKVSNEAR